MSPRERLAVAAHMAVGFFVADGARGGRWAMLAAGVLVWTLLLSVLNSVPPLRPKAAARLALLIRAVGFGTLTPLAGWALSGRPVGLGGWLLLAAFTPLFAGLYPLAQLPQSEADRTRGLGGSLLFAWVAVDVAFALFGIAAAATPGAVFPWLLVFGLAAWAAVLFPWYLRRERLTRQQHERGIRNALQAWALTDLLVLVVFAPR